MRRILQGAILVVALSTWPLWLAYQDEARRRAEAELRAAKAERELRTNWDERTLQMLGPYGVRLVSAWVKLCNGNQKEELLAHAEALAAGELWPPCAVPEQPTTRREGSTPPVPSALPLEASVPPQQQALLDILVTNVRLLLRAHDHGSSELLTHVGFTRTALDRFNKIRIGAHGQMTDPVSGEPSESDYEAGRRSWSALWHEGEPTYWLEVSEGRRRLFALLAAGGEARLAGYVAPQQPATAREPQRLSDPEEEAAAADAWVDERYGTPAWRAENHARAAERQPIRMRAQLRALHATASELAGMFLPGRSNAPSNCPQHGPNPEPDGFTSHCSQLPSCPGGAS